MPTPSTPSRVPFGDPRRLSRLRNGAAPVADQNGHSFFNWKYGDEEKAEVMVNPPQSRLSKTAGGANLRGLVERDCFRLYPSDQEEHTIFLGALDSSSDALYHRFGGMATESGMGESRKNN